MRANGRVNNREGNDDSGEWNSVVGLDSAILYTYPMTLTLSNSTFSVSNNIKSLLGRQNQKLYFIQVLVPNSEHVRNTLQ